MGYLSSQWFFFDFQWPNMITTIFLFTPCYDASKLDRQLQITNWWVFNALSWMSMNICFAIYHCFSISSWQNLLFFIDENMTLEHQNHWCRLYVFLVFGSYLFKPGRSWWRHQMKTFSALLALCAGKSPVSGEFPTQRPLTRSFDVFFYLRLIKRLSKHSRGWWFETLSRPLWRHCNVLTWSH